MSGRDRRWTPPALAALRARPHQRRAALVAAAMLGLLVAWVHWLGLIVAGGLVGLVSKTVPRAVIAGVGVGVLILAVQLAASPVVRPAAFIGLAPAAYVTIGAAIVAPVWGSLVRGII